MSKIFFKLHYGVFCIDVAYDFCGKRKLLLRCITRSFLLFAGYFFPRLPFCTVSDFHVISYGLK